MKDAYYFSHDSNARSDSKIIKLRSKFGWEGYGIYWALVELLRDANDYKLETDYTMLSFELRCSEETLKQIINDFGLFKVNAKRFYSESLLQRMALKEDRSKKARESAKKRWSKKVDANVMRTHSERNANAMQVKESKVKEKKGKEINENVSILDKYPFDDFWNFYDKKIDKDKCLKKWSKLTDNDKEQIGLTLATYLKSTPDKKFRRNPLTYLNNKTWNNQIIENARNNNQNTGQFDKVEFEQRFKEALKDI